MKLIKFEYLKISKFFAQQKNLNEAEHTLASQKLDNFRPTCDETIHKVWLYYIVIIILATRAVATRILINKQKKVRVLTFHITTSNSEI